MSYRARADGASGAKIRLTPAQRTWLERLDRGLDPTTFLHGRSEHGGAQGTLQSLKRFELIDAEGKITDKGRKALKS